METTRPIHHFLADSEIDYANCPITTLLEAIESYFHLIKDENFFSDQMLLLSKNVEENRSGADAIRVNMKSLNLLTPQSVQDALKPESRSDG